MTTDFLSFHIYSCSSNTLFHKAEKFLKSINKIISSCSLKPCQWLSFALCTTLQLPISPVILCTISFTPFLVNPTSLLIILGVVIQSSFMFLESGSFFPASGHLLMLFPHLRCPLFSLTILVPFFFYYSHKYSRSLNILHSNPSLALLFFKVYFPVTVDTQYYTSFMCIT